MEEYWCLPPPIEQQPHTTISIPLQIREEVEEGMKRAIPDMVEAMKETIKTDQIQCKEEIMAIIPVVVNEAVKKEIPLAVEAGFSRFLQEFKVSIPAMVKEVLQQMSHNPISRSLPHDVESPVLKTLQLLFVGTLPDSFLTMNNITTEEGAPLWVELVDMSGSRVENGPESSAKIKIVVLDGDFEVENREQKFNEKVVKPRKDKGALLKGECVISLMNGVATVGNLVITDNSRTMRNTGRFRLGAQVLKVFPGVAIREAVSEAFQVKERRLQSCGKEKRPSLDDNISCLKHIGSTISQRLANVQVNTVKDFLQLYHTNAKALRKNLGLAGNKWSETVDNAKSCLLTKECYQYHDDTEEIDVVLDCVFNIVSVTFKGQNSQSFDDLDDSHKECIYKIRCNAYEKRSELRTFIPTNQTSVQVEPLLPGIPHINMYHAGSTSETDLWYKERTRLNIEKLFFGQPEMLPNINYFAPDVSLMPLSSQPGELIYDTQERYYEPQNMGMFTGLFSNGSGSHMASTSNTQSALVIHDGIEPDELLTRCSRIRWKSVQFVVWMILIAGEVSVRRGFRALKRQKLG